MLTSVLKSINHQYEKGDYQPYLQLYIKNSSSFDEEALERWLNFEESPQGVKSTSLFAEETLKNWLNGKVYHQDMDKNKLIKQIEEILGEDTTSRIFVSQLSGKIKAIYKLSLLVNLFS